MQSLYGVRPLAASMEVKNNHAHVTTPIILYKFIEVNFSVGCMVWPWCCQFQHSTTMSLINKIFLHFLHIHNCIFFYPGPWSLCNLPRLYFNHYSVMRKARNLFFVIKSQYHSYKCIGRLKNPPNQQWWKDCKCHLCCFQELSRMYLSVQR